MTKILLVEDDFELADTVAKWFTLNRYIVEVARDGMDGRERVLGGAYDLIILDWQLPGVTGVEICREYRNQRGKTPIILLTGKNTTDEKETGLDSGADDYVTKPFSVRELAARVRAILRRPHDIAGDKIERGPLLLDLNTHEIFKDGEKLMLKPIDFALLEFFMRHPGEVFNSDVLIQRVWHADKTPGDDAVRSAIKRIRQAVDSDASQSAIESVKRVGYRFRL